MKKLLLATAIAAATTLTMNVQAATETDSFEIQIQVIGSCTLTTTTLNFGEYVGTAGDIDTVTAAMPGTLGVNCTTGADYTIGLDHVGVLENPALDTIAFETFQDAAFITDWNNTTDLLAATGDGTEQTHDVYAQLAITGATPLGDYTGTVTVNVEF